MFGIANTTNHAVALLKDLGLGEEAMSSQLQLLAHADARYLKDLKINIANALAAETLSKKEAYLVAYAVAVNEKNNLLQQAFSTLAKQNEANEKEVAEAASCASLLAANNVYYRFRHFMHDEFYNNAPAGIRMSIMANPLLGKEFFELVSLVVSAVNGCELCVTSHEKTLIGHGTAKQRIHDAMRLGAVVRGLSVLL